MNDIPNKILAASSIRNAAPPPRLCSAMQSKPIDAVIFDWDETMAKSKDFYVKVKQGTIDHLKEQGIEMLDEHKGKAANDIQADYHNHDSARHLLAHYFGEENVGAAEKAYHNTLAEFDKNVDVELFEGALETLNMLDALNIPYAVATNSQHDRMVTKIQKMLPDHFDSMVIVGSSPERRGKPHTDIVEEALRQLKEKHPEKEFRNKNILFVGDNHKNDILPAHKLGMQPVLFSDAEKAAFHKITPIEAVYTNYPAEIGYVSDHQSLQELIQHRVHSNTSQASVALR